MAVTLTISLKTGDLDILDYSCVKITKVIIDYVVQEAQVTYRWGNENNGWKPGKISKRIIVKLDVLPEIITKAFEAMLHQKLIDNSLVAGIVE